eukprot:scaffold20712_cov100-Isochrysis_galbana.AAC.5
MPYVRARASAGPSTEHAGGRNGGCVAAAVGASTHTCTPQRRSRSYEARGAHPRVTPQALPPLSVPERGPGVPIVTPRHRPVRLCGDARLSRGGAEDPGEALLRRRRGGGVIRL